MSNSDLFGSFVSGGVAVYNTHRNIEHNTQMEGKRERLQVVLSALGALQQFTIHHLDQVALRKRQEEERQLQVEARQLQAELAANNRETQLLIAETQRATTLALPETNQVFANWPLHLYPSQILTSHPSSSPQPLKILVAPPEVEYDRFQTLAPTGSSLPHFNEGQLMTGLRRFLEEHYPLESPLRPTELLDGAWDSKRFRGGSSIKALHSLLKSEPILILELAAMGEYLELRVGYWGLGQERYHYKTVGSKLSLRLLVQEAAKRRTLTWKQEREQLLQRGYEVVWLKQRNPVGEENVTILGQNEELEHLGFEPVPYKTHSKDLDSVYQTIVNWLCCVSGWFSDAHHLIHTAHPEQVPPLLPSLLPKLLEDRLTDQFLQPLLADLIIGYHTILEELSKEQNYAVPELALQVALDLSGLADKSWSMAMLEDALRRRLSLSGIVTNESTGLGPLLPAARTIPDPDYLAKLVQCLRKLGEGSESERLTVIEVELRERQRVEKRIRETTMHSSTTAQPKITAVDKRDPASTILQGETPTLSKPKIDKSAPPPPPPPQPTSPKEQQNEKPGMLETILSAAVSTLGAAMQAAREAQDRPQKVLEVLHECEPQDDLYVSPSIPAKKLANARSICQVPNHEEILGLIDCTFFGSAKDCVLFGTQGLYYHNVGGYQGKILYDHLSNTDFSADGDLLYTSGGGAIKMAGSAISAHDLGILLVVLKHYLSS